MIKISRLADYAVVVLATLKDAGTKAGEVMMSAADISREAGLPEPTVSKVLKLLAKAGLVESVRGAGGGYHLGRPVADMTVSDVIMAVDGPISLTACVDGADHVCDYAVRCPVRGRWDEVNFAIREALENVALADMLRQPLCKGKNKMKEDELHEHL